jgi:archaellum biogenesis protein FlaJ (TadC family)
MGKKFSLTKGKNVFIVDSSLIIIFILLIYSGLELHVAAHGSDHAEWEFWANYHVITGIVSLIAIYFHVKAHWGWYKSLFNRGIGKKSRVTVIISLLFFILTITGIILVFFIDGGNSSVGLWHYRLGLVITAFLLAHTISRFPLIIKGLRKRKKDSKNTSGQNEIYDTEKAA